MKVSLSLSVTEVQNYGVKLNLSHVEIKLGVNSIHQLCCSSTITKCVSNKNCMTYGSA